MTVDARSIRRRPRRREAVPAPAIRLEAFLPYRLNVLASAVSRGLERIYSERHGIDIPQWRVLATLGQHQRMTAKAIGDHSHMHKTKVSRAVAALAARGLLSRLSNPSDRREALLELTDRGRAIYADLVPAARAYEARLTRVLGAAEQAALEAIISRLIDEALALGQGPQQDEEGDQRAKEQRR